MGLSEKNAKHIFPLGAVFLIMLSLTACGQSPHYRLHSSTSLPEGQVSLIEQENKGIKILLVNGEEIPRKFVVISGSLKYETLPGNHTLVLNYDQSITDNPMKRGTQTAYHTLSIGLVTIGFEAEKGGKYLLGCDFRGDSWHPWVKDAPSGKIVSRVVDSETSKGINPVKECGFDNKHVMLSANKDNILDVPRHLYWDIFGGKAKLEGVRTGTVLYETIFKENVSGRWQYSRVYLLHSKEGGYFFVKKEGVTCP